MFPRIIGSANFKIFLLIFPSVISIIKITSQNYIKSILSYNICKKSKCIEIELRY